MLSQKQYDASVLWLRDELDVEPGRDYLTGTDSPKPSSKAAVVRARHMLDDDSDTDDSETEDAARQIAAAIKSQSE